MDHTQDALPRHSRCDFLVIGDGVSGLELALGLAPHGEVVLLTKCEPGESNSLYAQGGIAAVLDPGDRFEDHLRDTLTAGDGLCHPEAARHVVENGTRAIERLLALGVPFSRDGKGLHLTREGGHSARRVIHTADATGRAVVETLLARVRENPRIRLVKNHIAIDLITDRQLGHSSREHQTRNRCHGCHALEIGTTRILTFQARFTILATGGAGKVYLYTSNPDCATGDGIAMAYRAGCRVANLEFVQFHPTCLFHPLAKSFLISEAVRGEGGLLLLKNGDRFMPRHHPMAELAPRDSVARAIDFEMKRTGDDCVFLDISHKGADFIRSHFPTISQSCQSFGIDMSRGPIPVVPAAHYTCGGVVTDLAGRTDVENLYAVGEVAHTGLHGANRLASNSLLECLVFADSAVESIIRRLSEQEQAPPPGVPLWDPVNSRPIQEAVMLSHNWDQIRRLMWNYVGIVRSDNRLVRAEQRIELFSQEINDLYWSCEITRDLVELRNLALVASLIIRSAIHRKESRGLHFNTDHPDKNEEWRRDTILEIKR
ncbi:MAG: L-aspartate oxidase [Magnetococcales bacterium]|nr:L-aspartate oxidase [Magnetococcales bacterium]